MTGYLYMLTFEDGKSYIGMTRKSPEKRFVGHRSRANSESRIGGNGAMLYSAWRLQGAPALKVLALVEDSLADETEKKAIEIFNTLHPNGYNMALGGSTSPGLSEIVAKKISKSKKGVVFSEEHKAALSLSQRGKRRPALAAALTGKKASAETRSKMAASARALKRSPEHIAKLRISAAKARAIQAAKVANK